MQDSLLVFNSVALFPYVRRFIFRSDRCNKQLMQRFIPKSAPCHKETIEQNHVFGKVLHLLCLLSPNTCYVYRKSDPFPERRSRGHVSSLPQSLKPICQLPHTLSDPKFNNLLHCQECPLNWLLFVFSEGPASSPFAKVLKLLSLFFNYAQF